MRYSTPQVTSMIVGGRGVRVSTHHRIDVSPVAAPHKPAPRARRRGTSSRCGLKRFDPPVLHPAVGCGSASPTSSRTAESSNSSFLRAPDAAHYLNSNPNPNPIPNPNPNSNPNLNSYRRSTIPRT